jgi:sulfide:quinone oxidoreductase
MEIKTLSDDFMVTGQVTAKDVADLAARGVGTIICNRPDHEDANQPPFADIKNAAEKAGLHAIFIPVVSGASNDEQVKPFRKALDVSPKPILAYCRTGNRSAALWTLCKL